MQLDWQLLEVTSLVFDISYFLYVAASQEVLAKFDDYLQFYHQELSKQIGKLGSDPERLYPFAVFEKEWKKYCAYGYALAFTILKAILANQDEVPNMNEMEVDNYKKDIQLFTKFDNEEEYIRRIKMLTEFMVERDYI